MKFRSIIETKDFTPSCVISFFVNARIFFITRCIYMMSWKVSALSSRVDMSLQKQKGQNKIKISKIIDFENVSDVCAYFAQLSMYTECSATGIGKFKG